MKLDQQTLGYISVFENHTGAGVKDCFFKGKVIVFIVKEGEIGKAVGKKGSNIKPLINKFKKPIRVIEYSSDAVKFVKNLIYPTKAEIEQRDDKIVIITENNKTKGFLFGRDKSKLKEMQEIINRFFDVEIRIE